MFFRQLKYFAAVAEFGRFSEAAKRVHVSQPALGMQVKKLEEELGAQLFNGHARGVEWTAAGNILFGYATEIIDKVEEAKHAVAQTAGRVEGSIHIGFTPAMGRQLLHPLIEACSHQYPELELSFTEGYSDELRSAVLSGELNLTFSYESEPDERLIVNELFIDQFYLVGPRKLIGRNKEIDFADLVKFPLVMEKRRHITHRLLMDTAAGLGLTLNAAIEVDAVDVRRELLVNHASCTVIPYVLFSTEIETGQLCARRIVNPLFTRTLFLLQRKGSANTLAETAVASIIRDIIDKKIEEGRLRWKILP